MSLRDLLIENHNNFMGHQMREYYIHGNIPFYIVHDLDPEKTNLEKIIKTLRSSSFDGGRHMTSMNSE